MRHEEISAFMACSHAKFTSSAVIRGPYDSFEGGPDVGRDAAQQAWETD